MLIKTAVAGVTATARVLAKEVSAFNIRVLTFVLGTFNTEFNTKQAAFGENALPAEYQGSFAEKLMGAIRAGDFVPNGDREKAMSAVYEVIAGERQGVGREGEKLIPLGSDMISRLQGAAGTYHHAIEVFGGLAKSVDASKPRV